MSLDKVEVVKEEIATEVWMANLEGVLGCAELIISIDEEGQHCS